MQTATPTPVFYTVEPLASFTPTATPSATPRSIPAVLSGKIVFLSDREGATEEERLRAGLIYATPQVTPQPYVFDPETGQLGRLTDIWPYEIAVDRDSWSADARYESYNQALLWTNIPVGSGGRRPTEILAIHYYDYFYKVEHVVTQMGVGIVYDPAWSPVSDEIAFVATESGNDEIWIINRDGTNVRQLTRNEWEWDKHPSWSPDGQQIIFYSNRTGNNQLWIMNKDGSEQRLLMDWGPHNDWDPVWVKYLNPAPPQVREPNWQFQKPSNEY
jgi:Tol biopolymer transport system component